MRFKAVEVTDKLGRTVILRNAEVADAEELIRYLRVTAGETPFMIREPDEVTLTREQEECFIRNCLDGEREVMMVAEVDGKLAGNCSLRGVGAYRKYAHRCDVAIALYQEYCGCGIGRKMMEKLLDLAKGMGYEQAELNVVSENKRAVGLYESLGFVKYGCFPRNMKYADGTYVSADWMMKVL